MSGTDSRLDAAQVAELKTEALRLGFDAVGVAPAVTPPDYDRFRNWLASGCGADMTYLERQAEARRHPASILESVRSVIMVSLVYGKGASEPAIDNDADARPRDGECTAHIARYAAGTDYHRLMWDRLDLLLEWLVARVPGLVGRSIVDTAPLLERDYARLAGLGWIGKNTLLIHPRLGSYTFLGGLLVNCTLEPDAPFTRDHCGTCTRCLEACPTSAFVEPRRLDAGRCISYWTIEHRGVIPDEWADKLEGWVFGCDICQEVCPWNRKAPAGHEAGLSARPGQVEPDLVSWIEADPSAFRAWIRTTAMSRARRVGLVRNAALILGTRRAPAAIPGLSLLLADDEPVVRASAAWALGRFGREVLAAREALLAASGDPDPLVRDTIERSLRRS